MKNIISELFYGNIDPQTRSYQKGSYIQKYMTILANAEEVLTKNLSGGLQLLHLLLLRNAFLF